MSTIEERLRVTAEVVAGLRAALGCEGQGGGYGSDHLFVEPTKGSNYVTVGVPRKWIVVSRPNWLGVAQVFNFHCGPGCEVNSVADAIAHMVRKSMEQAYAAGQETKMAEIQQVLGIKQPETEG